MNILITGGAGFIGSHVAEYHLNQQDAVHVLDDLSTGSQDNVNLFKNNPNFHFTHADILTVPNLEELVCWADRIYHLAAVVGVLRVIKDHEKILSTNISGTERLLRAAKVSSRNPRILLASTSEVYGETHDKALREDFNLVVGQAKKSCVAYVVSKMALESFGLAYYEKFNLAITNLRFFNTIGPRQSGHYGMVVPRFIASATQNEPIVVYGTGKQTRSFVDVRDVVQIMDKIANTPEAIGEVVNVGQDEEVSILELAQLIKKLTKSQSPIHHLSYKEAYGADYEDIMRRRPDLTKLSRLIQYDYQWNLHSTIIDLNTYY